MSAGRFAALIDAYGAEPSRWPAAERAAAQAFAASDPGARARIEEMSALDRTLDRLPTEQPGDGLKSRLLRAFDDFAAARREGAMRRTARWFGKVGEIVWPGAPLWQPASAFAVSLVVGLAMGLMIPSAVSAHAVDPSANILVVAPAVFDLDHGN